MTNIMKGMNMHQLLRCAAEYDAGSANLNQQQVYLLLDALHDCASKNLIGGARMIFGSVVLVKDSEGRTTITFKRRAFKNSIKLREGKLRSLTVQFKASDDNDRSPEAA